jgi:hypothetical protein
MAVDQSSSRGPKALFTTTTTEICADGLLLYVTEASYEPGTSPLSPAAQHVDPCACVTQLVSVQGSLPRRALISVPPSAAMCAHPTPLSLLLHFNPSNILALHRVVSSPSLRVVPSYLSQADRRTRGGVIVGVECYLATPCGVLSSALDRRPLSALL